MRVSAVSPTLGAHSCLRSSLLRCTRALTVRRRCALMLPRAVWPPLARPPRPAVSRRPAHEPTVSRRPASHWWSTPFEVTVRTGSTATFRPPLLPHGSDRPRTVLLRHPRHLRMIPGDGSSPASFRLSRPSPVCVSDTASDRMPSSTDASKAGAPFAPHTGKPTWEAPLLPLSRSSRDGAISAPEAR